MFEPFEPRFHRVLTELQTLQVAPQSLNHAILVSVMTKIRRIQADVLELAKSTVDLDELRAAHEELRSVYSDLRWRYDSFMA